MKPELYGLSAGLSAHSPIPISSARSYALAKIFQFYQGLVDGFLNDTPAFLIGTCQLSPVSVRRTIDAEIPLSFVSWEVLRRTNYGFNDREFAPRNPLSELFEGFPPPQPSNDGEPGRSRLPVALLGNMPRNFPHPVFLDAKISDEVFDRNIDLASVGGGLKMQLIFKSFAIFPNLTQDHPDRNQSADEGKQTSYKILKVKQPGALRARGVKLTTPDKTDHRKRASPDRYSNSGPSEGDRIHQKRIAQRRTVASHSCGGAG